MWLGRLDELGRLFVRTGLAIDPTVYLGGILIGSPSGGVALIDSANDPVGHVNGLPVNVEGRLCFEYGGAIDHYWMGLPRTATGRLVTQLNQIPVAKDTFVQGVRVGPLGGVYTVDLAPPLILTGFSDGFDELGFR